MNHGQDLGILVNMMVDRKVWREFGSNQNLSEMKERKEEGRGGKREGGWGREERGGKGIVLVIGEA